MPKVEIQIVWSRMTSLLKGCSCKDLKEVIEKGGYLRISIQGREV